MIIEPDGFCRWLFDDDCLDGAFFSGLLNGVLVLFRNIIDDNLGHLVAQLENFRAGIRTKPAGSAGIFNFDFHNKSPL